MNTDTKVKVHNKIVRHLNKHARPDGSQFRVNKGATHFANIAVAGLVLDVLATCTLTSKTKAFTWRNFDDAAFAQTVASAFLTGPTMQRLIDIKKQIRTIDASRATTRAVESAKRLSFSCKKSIATELGFAKHQSDG